MAKQHEDACLDKMPVEIKTMIMKATPDMDTLRSITHASPAYHKVYVGAKKDILNNLAIREFILQGVDLLDPMTAIEAAQLDLHDPDRDTKIAELLERHFQSATQALPQVPTLDVDQSIALIRLQHVVAELTESFCEATILSHPRTLQPYDYSNLSLSENCRIQRAFYRWEIYAQLFGYAEADRFSEDFATRPSSAEAQAKLFLCRLPWHEVEEFKCIQEYAISQYAGVLPEIALELAPENPRFADKPRDRLGKPVGSFEIDGPLTYDYQASLVSLGPQKLHKVLQASQQDLEGLITPYLLTSENGLTDAFLEHDANVDVCDDPAANFYGQDHQPTPGWLWTSGNGNGNGNGNVVHKQFLVHHPLMLMSWGYIMWDQERFDYWQITEYDVDRWPCCVVRGPN